MPNSQSQLADILREEIALYRDILAVKSEEKEAILAFSTPALEATTAAQEELAGKALILESRRISLIREMTPRRRLSSDEPTLTEVLEWVEEPARSLLAGLGRDLVLTCFDLSRAQDENAQLIGGSAGYLHELFETLLAKARPRPVAYDPAGIKTHGRETLPSLWDQRL